MKTIPLFYLFVFSLLFFGCSTDETTLDDESLARIEKSILPIFRIEGQPQVPNTIEERLEYYGVPGVSVAVALDGEIAWARGYGYADIASGKTVTSATLFQVASISKPIAAMGILELTERNTIELDVDINQYLKTWQVEGNGFTDTEKVTLRRILNHTAGLSVSGFEGYSRDEDRISTLDVLKGLGNSDVVKVIDTPGERRRYSGGGYTVMQFLMEEQLNNDFASLMDDLILKPLDMQNSTFAQPLPTQLRDRAAMGYREDGSPVEGSWHVHPEQAAAGLWSTPTDILKYALSLQRAYAGSTKEILAPETAAEMLKPGINNQGLGLAIRGTGKRFGHSGANAGYRSNLDAYLQGGDALIVMTNSDAGISLAREIMSAIAAEYGWEGFEPDIRTFITLSEEQQKRFVGTYQFEWGNERIFIEEGNLWIKGEGWDEPLQLYAATEEELFDSNDGYRRVFEMKDGQTISMMAGGNTAMRISD